MAATSDNAGGNSDNSNAGGNSDNSNAGGNSDNSNAGGNSDNSNAGGNSDNSNAGGNSDNSNAGGNSDNSNAGGNSGGATGSPDTTVDQRSGNSLGISGSQTTTKEHGREIAIDLQKAKDAGEKISVKGSAITFSKGPVTISITTTAEPKETEGVISAGASSIGIRSISMEHQPMTAQFEDTTLATASFKADLMSLPPPDSAIAAVITKEPGQPAKVAFDQAAWENGYQLDAIAYAMNITKNNLTDRKDIGKATVTMSVNSSWVAVHGGVDNIRIARLADDGTSQLLETRFIGPDNSANQLFEGTSPGGLSIFALITVKTPPEAVISQSVTQPAIPRSLPIPPELYSLLIALPVAVLGIFLTVMTRKF